MISRHWEAIHRTPLLECCFMCGDPKAEEIVVCPQQPQATYFVCKDWLRGNKCQYMEKSHYKPIREKR